MRLGISGFSRLSVLLACDRSECCHLPPDESVSPLGHMSAAAHQPSLGLKNSYFPWTRKPLWGCSVTHCHLRIRMLPVRDAEPPTVTTPRSTGVRTGPIPRFLVVDGTPFISNCWEAEDAKSVSHPGRRPGAPPGLEARARAQGLAGSFFSSY